ncbi:hypothetical protein EVC45_12610 [Paraburkholderia sp. UYCP14C]|uniref:hypothetical protein n=1 Tax=Paraburkholderia sp. UYCP14C TaxID=2511130 RepID=UPI00101F58A2|nr:hypothetical protein [Paraburkholderia sp. UYCP14C]RZF29295.1 hypothetical protein EVC45_12610 [Paraburkholderia sp. UYCP14C]
MNKLTSTVIAAVAALTLSGGAYAQNNTLATPTTKSPAAATSGYGTPTATNTDSGAGSRDSSQPTSMNNSAMSPTPTPAFGLNNTLARPSTQSPAGQ